MLYLLGSSQLGRFSVSAPQIFISIMAQELSIELPIPATAPPVASEALQGQSASIDFPPPKAAPQPVNHDRQSLQGVNQVEFGQKASEDDEVQFVFAVPRRRKRKRKRYEA
jgi:hypothetical protein